MSEEKRFCDLNDILADKTLERFCKLNNYTFKTKQSMANALLRYCNMLEKTPTALITEAKKNQIDEPDIDLRVICDYIAKFPDVLTDLSPSTQLSYYNSVKLFYTRNNVILPFTRYKKVEPDPENSYVPKASEIQGILLHASSIRNRAIVLCQCSSGMGTSEILSLTVEDFWKGYDAKTKITTFRPLRKKTTIRYITFISPEATDAVLKHLESYEGEMLFDIEETGLMSMYKRLSMDAGYEKKDSQFSKIRSHGMRKFFTTQMRDAGMPVDMVDFLTGKIETKTRRAYYNFTEANLKAIYIDYVKHVTVTEKIREVTNYQELLDENLNLSMKYQHMEAEFDEIKKMLRHSELFQHAREDGMIRKKILELDGLSTVPSFNENSEK